MKKGSRNPKFLGTNCRTNKRINAFGKNLTVAQWAREIGISPYTIYHRLRVGFNSEECLLKGQHERRMV